MKKSRSLRCFTCTQSGWERYEEQEGMPALGPHIHAYEEDKQGIPAWEPLICDYEEDEEGIKIVSIVALADSEESGDNEDRNNAENGQVFFVYKRNRFAEGDCCCQTFHRVISFRSRL